MQPDVRELVASLLCRSDLTEAGRAALRQAFPNAPLAMIDTASFHLFTDGVTAAAEWLAAVERFLRDPSVGIDEGAAYHLLYHLYNWHQFRALLPAGKEGMIELLGDAKHLLAEDDPQAVRRVLDDLEDMLRGGLSAPKID